MKTLIFVLSTIYVVYVVGSTVKPETNTDYLYSKECTWGPSYWCQNLTTAANCRAVKHCIQTVWIYKELPPDTSSVCQTCLDMVKQARDQLESNETQELIKEVFEGSCALIHLKPIVKECDKIADNYIPELIDTLASQMNPQVVCSVAGLCNNDRVRQLLLEDGNSSPQAQDACDGCQTVVGLVEKRFDGMSRDEVLQSFLRVCGKVGSLSDACSNIVITYFTEIYNHLQENLNPTDVCLLAGECSAQFHKHATVEITPLSHVGYVPVGKGDDLPCELCEQLVNHLRDLLIANTTEDEFKKVLEGLCNQTKSFKDECLGIVEEYYSLIYGFLVSELNSTAVCSMVGICPESDREEVILAPLVPLDTEEKALKIAPPARINMAFEGSEVKIMETPEQAQLPIERIMPPHVQIMYDTQLCTFCEYFLHYVQQEITNPSTETEIKRVVDQACYKLPSSINDTCIQFVNTYGDAFVAILAQEIDPSTVCPLIRACPSSEVKDVEIFMQRKGDNSKCPLCLFAVTKLEEMVKDKKTEADIKQALDKLCIYLPSNLKSECDDFVNTYANELVEMLVADLDPKEVCVYLKLCTDTSPAPPLIGEDTIPHPEVHYGGEIETNEIPDNTYNGNVEPFMVSKRKSNKADKPECVLCEFVMKEIEDQLNNKKNDDEIKQIVLDVCNVMPKSVRQECDDFVNQYADTVIQLLIGALQPNEVCAVLNICSAKNVAVKAEIFDCALCQVFVEAIYRVLANPTVDHNIDHVLEKACRALPQRDRAKCDDVIEKYGQTIFDLVIHLKNRKEVCEAIFMCTSEKSRAETPKLLGTTRCTQGPAYWCASDENAQECGQGAVNYCQSRANDQQSRHKREKPLIGASKCSYGPSYWCESAENARECGSGAIEFCQNKVWKSNTRK